MNKREINKVIRPFIHSMHWFGIDHRNLTDDIKLVELMKLLELNRPDDYKKIHILVLNKEFDWSTVVDILGFDPTNHQEYNHFWDTMMAYRNKKVYKETRDNKLYPNKGSGAQGSWRSIVRYPSKKRSLRTWRNFYNLFPEIAKQDGWDGKTSSRYK